MKKVHIFLDNNYQGSKIKGDNYELLKDFTHKRGVINEYFDENDYIIPIVQNGVLTETITQQEIDERAELEQENEFLRATIEQLEKGNALALEIFSFVRKHTGLTNNQKSVLKSLAVKLFSGQIEEALNEWATISRPTNENKMQKVYDKLKVKFDNL